MTDIWGIRRGGGLVYILAAEMRNEDKECSGNLVRNTSGKKLILILLRNIWRSTQCLVFYGWLQKSVDRSVRP